MFSTQNDNDMIECPYNPAHRMLRKRLQTHLLKCRVNYPEVELQKCPFNQTHLIPEPEFVHHVTNCSDRKLIMQYKYDAGDEKEPEECVKHAPIECDENWDDTEVEDYNPRKHVENANVLRRPEGTRPGERKEFIKKERKRLGDFNSDDEAEEKRLKIKKEEPVSDDESQSHSDNRRGNRYRPHQRPRTPSPPSARVWEASTSRSHDRNRPYRRSRSSRTPSPPPHRRSRNSRTPSPAPPPPPPYRREYRDRSPLERRPSPPRQRDSSPDYNMDDDPYYGGGGVSSSLDDKSSSSSSRRSSRYEHEPHHAYPYNRRGYFPPRPMGYPVGRGAHRGYIRHGRY